MREFLKTLWLTKKVQVIVATVALVGVIGGGAIAIPAIIHSNQNSNEVNAVISNPIIDDVAAENIDDKKTEVDAGNVQETTPDSTLAADSNADVKADAGESAALVDKKTTKKPASNASDNKNNNSSDAQNNAGSSTDSGNGSSTDSENESDSNQNSNPPAKVQYAVSFVTNSGSTLKDRLYDVDEELGSLPSSNKLNHIFEGWYYDTALTQPVATNDKVNKNTTLYAKYNPVAGIEYEEKQVTAIATDVASDFTIKVFAETEMSAADVKAGLEVYNISDADGDAPMEVVSVSASEYQLEFANGGYEEGSSYKVLLKDDKLSFEGAQASAREFNFTTKATPTMNLQYSEDVKYLKDSEFSNITMNGQAVDSFSLALFEISSDSNGQAQVAQKRVGTFVSNKTLIVGDVITLYSGVRPDKRTLDTPAENCGDVAYVKITAYDAATKTYTFTNAEADEVIFTPDMLPVSLDADEDATDGDILTVDKSVLTFTDDVYEYISLDSQTTIDVGDFIVFYTGDFNNAQNSVISKYAEITNVSLSGDKYTITYNVVDWSYVESTMDIYAGQAVDVEKELSEEQIESLENSVARQAEESGFAEEAGLYLAGLALATDTFTRLAPDMDLTDYKATLMDGTPISPSEIQLMAENAKVEIDDPEIEVDLGFNLKEFEGEKGLRLTLKITTTITIHMNDDEDVKIEIEGDFVQETKIGTTLKAAAEWKVWGIFPYIADYKINAVVDLYDYTGIGIKADITTHEAEDDDDDEVSLADEIKNLLEQFESSEEDEDDGVSISTSLTEKYKAMMENESDWVKLFEQEMLSIEKVLPPAIPIVAVKLELDFVVELNINASIGMDFYYKNAKRYAYTFRMHEKTVRNDVINLCEEQYEFDFYAMGAIGVRAGVKMEVAIGLFSTALDSVSFDCTAGAYVKMWGYFYYDLKYTASMGRTQNYCGSLYFELGCYLEIGVKAQVLNGKFSTEATLYENEWPLWSAGMQENVLDFTIAEEDISEINLKQYIREVQLPDSFFSMHYLDLVVGDTNDMVFSDAPSDNRFAITSTNDKIKYDYRTNTISVEPDEDDKELEGDVIFTWVKAPMTFSSRPIRRTVHVKWTNTRDGYVIVPYTNGGSYVPIINQAYNSKITAPANPEKMGYVFKGWFADEEKTVPYTFPEVMGAFDTDIYAAWEPATDTKYTVRYYWQNLESDEYTLHDYVTSHGTTNETVKPMPEEYEGFTTPVAEEVTILADGSAVVNYYYNRVIKHVTFDPGVADGEKVVYEYKYGAKVSAPVFAANGFVFKDWDKTVASTMDATDVTYTAQWEKAKDTQYRIEYYVQNADGVYELKDTVFGQDETDKEFTVADLKADKYLTTGVALSNITQSGVDIISAERNAVVTADGKAVFKVNYGRAKVNATYKLNNGSEDEKRTFYVGQIISYPEAVREGYIFDGWYKDAELTVKVTATEIATADATFYAKWKEKTSIVVEHYTMDVNGNYPEKAVRTEHIPETEGNTITAGNYAASDLQVADAIEYSSASYKGETVTEFTTSEGKNVIKLYYVRKQYALTWDLGEEVTVKNEAAYSKAGNYYYGATITVPELAKRGYAYEWETTPAATMPAGNVSYKAIWTENDKFNVTFVDFDNTVISKIEGYGGEEVTAPLNPNRAGYTFTGWDKTIPETVSDSENVTIKAQYSVIDYTLSFTLNDGEFAEGITTLATYNIESENVVLPAPVKTGYTFAGWFTDSEFTSAASQITKGSTGDKAFYAKWTSNTYKIVFSASGADNESVKMNDLTVSYNETKKLPANIYTKEGYGFVGWTTDPEGTSVEYKDQAEIKNLTVIADKTINFYALFVQGYSITYANMYDAKMAEDAPTFFSVLNSTITLDAPAKSRTGYQFKGWYAKEDLTGEEVTVITPATMSRNVTVYAKWEANPYSITFDANHKDGGADHTQLCYYDADVTLDALSEIKFVNPGYNFMGWTTSQNSKEVEYADNATVKNLATSGDIRLYAVWQEIDYVIYYFTNALGGKLTHSNPGTYTITSADIKLADPETPEGYQFLGWYTLDNKHQKVDTIQQGSSGNVTLLAEFAHAGTFSIEYVGTENGESTYNIVRILPTGTKATTDIQHVYFRTENGTAVGGTASAINFLHVGGPDVYLTFGPSDGYGSTKSFTVKGENAGNMFSIGTKKYSASAVSTSDLYYKYYFVKIYDVVSTEGNCTGEINSNYGSYTRYLDDKGATLAANATTTTYSYVDPNWTGKHVITDAGFSKNHMIKHNTKSSFLEAFMPNVPALTRQYIAEEASNFYYNLEASLSEDDDGYQYVSYVPYNVSYQIFKFEIKPGKHYDAWEHNVLLGGSSGKGVVTAFSPDGNGGNATYIPVRTTKNNKEMMKFPNADLSNTPFFRVEFDASGSLDDDWDIKNVVQYMSFDMASSGSCVAVAPMSFGKYDAGSTISVSLEYDKVFLDFNTVSRSDVYNLLTKYGIPVSSVTAVTIKDSYGTNVVNAEVVLDSNFEVTTAVNDRFMGIN